MTDKLNKIIKISFVFIAVFLFFSVSAFSQEDKKKEQEKPRLSREAQMAMVEAQKFFDKQDWASARKPLLDYLDTNPEVVDEPVYLMLGYCWYSDGNLKEAVKVFKKGYDEYPDSFDLLSYYASTLYEMGDYDQAAPLMEKVYEKDEKKQVRYLEAAYSAYYQNGKFNDTIRVIKKMIAVSKEPKKNWYTILVQVYYNDLRNMDQAEKYLYEALDRFPLEASYWSFLSLIRQVKEDYYGSAGAYEIYSYVKPPQKPSEWKQLISIEHNIGLPLRVAKNLIKEIDGDINKEEEQGRVADAYARAFKFDEAVSYLDKILAKKPSAKLMLKKAQILFSARRNKDAIAACDDLIAVKPDEADGMAYVIKGRAAWDLKDWRTMEEAYKRAQGFKKARAEAKYALSIIQSLDEARKQVEQ